MDADDILKKVVDGIESAARRPTDEIQVVSFGPNDPFLITKLRRVNSQVHIEPIVADVDHTKIAELADGVGMIVDGTDNFESEHVAAEAARLLRIPRHVLIYRLEKFTTTFKDGREGRGIRVVRGVGTSGDTERVPRKVSEPPAAACAARVKVGAA